MLGCVFDNLLTIFGGHLNEIILRRVEAKEKCINFHTDYNVRTL
jgi:hypothetical protein